MHQDLNELSRALFDESLPIEHRIAAIEAIHDSEEIDEAQRI
jgi:hypothetical protein